MNRRYLILGGGLCVGVVLFSFCFAMYGRVFSVWRSLPMARGWRFEEALAESLQTMLGKSRPIIQATLGTPDDISGPYSWWSLLENTADGELSAVVFFYDEYQNVTRVIVRETESPETDPAPLPLNLESYRHESPKDRHQMHLALEQLSKQGQLPEELRSIDDVERYFPKARFVENWYYYAGFAGGKLVVGFDRDGKVKEIWEDW